MLSRILAVMMLICIVLPNYTFAGGEEVVVYSARNEHLIQPIFEAYTKKTGVRVKYITGVAGALLVRLKAEGANTPADMF
ncbi:MAG: Fe(3+) ABC transporter substrate-binding protein, partial [Desulforhopalus sp.]